MRLHQRAAVRRQRSRPELRRRRPPAIEQRFVERVARRRHRGPGRPGMGGGGKALVIDPPVDRIGMMASHHDRGAVLARDGDDAGTRRLRLQPVAERVDFQILRAPRIRIRRAANRDAIERRTRAPIEPAVGNDAGRGRMHAGEDRRMARAGLGRGMALIAVGEGDTFGEPGKPAGEAVAIAREEIGGELVDRYGDDELGRDRRFGCCRHRQQRRNEQKNPIFCHGRDPYPSAPMTRRYVGLMTTEEDWQSVVSVAVSARIVWWRSAGRAHAQRDPAICRAPRHLPPALRPAAFPPGPAVPATAA